MVTIVIGILALMIYLAVPWWMYAILGTAVLAEILIGVVLSDH